MSEILANLDDINANLPSQDDPAGLSNGVIEATDANTSLLQISVARIVRGYLSGTINNVTLMGWDEPDATPDIIREVASKLIAAQVYFISASRSSLEIADKSFSQRMYDSAMVILNKIISGEIILEEVPIETSSLSLDDAWPVDDTDRAFTMGMVL